MIECVPISTRKEASGVRAATVKQQRCSLPQDRLRMSWKQTNAAHIGCEDCRPFEVASVKRMLVSWDAVEEHGGAEAVLERSGAAAR